jgi:transcriptional regulator with XRE-family HTH domain
MTVIDVKLLGENIRAERKRQLLTIEQLAEKAGITDNFLGKIERGEGTPSLKTIDSIACALDVTIDFLKSNREHNTEHKFINSLIDINELTKENKDKFIDFISTNIKYFKE